MTHAVAEYLHAMLQIHASGQATDETSYYDALTAMLNACGAELDPPVRAILTLKNRGAGIPDGGLFTAPQLRPKAEVGEESGILPARGALEVKPLADDVYETAKSDQVQRYLERYGQVLVTNYREFLVVALDRHGKVIFPEHFSLAPSESAFWKAARVHGKTAEQRGDALERFLQRAMLRPAPITSPEDLAWIMASYAKEALEYVEKSPLDTLDNFKQSLEDALGIRFKDKKSEHFFHSTLVQTLFYGIFSGWVIWCRENNDEATFDWRQAAWTLHLPALKSLFAEVATPGRIQILNLNDLMNLTAEALARVDRPSFFRRFENEDAIQYFYEPFLESYDMDLRKEMGVWYTPREVVHYMVERIDQVLRSELGIKDGFANKDVYVLDPAVGTGSFLVEVLRVIERTLKASGEEEFLASELKASAMERVFGFEIMPAPFVVAHLQVGAFLQSRGVSLDFDHNERAGIYLTNSLTGWEPPEGPQKKLSFVELEEEKEAADRVKRGTPILVILGNPPYNAFAGTSPEEEHGLVDVYKDGLQAIWNIKKFNLDELYARFMRVAERQIADHSGRGIICYISSYSYLGDPSFVVLRQRLWSQFDKAWIDSMNGDSRETGKRTPDGLPDPSVFSTERNREGIQLGTAIGLFVKKGEPAKEKEWRYRDFWGVRKREELVASLGAADLDGTYRLARPDRKNLYSFRPMNVSPAYYAWPRLVDLCKTDPSNGLMEKRESSLVSIDLEPLQARMSAYFDKSIPWEEFQPIGMGLSHDAARFKARAAREKAQREDRYDVRRIVQYVIRPFDHQYAYYTPARPVWNEPRPALWAQFWKGNSFFVSRRIGGKSLEGPPFYWTSRLIDDHLLSPDAAAFAVRLRPRNRQLTGFDGTSNGDQVTHNYSESAVNYLQSIGIHVNNDETIASLLWLHALAIGFAPKYLQENTDGVKQDWPRIPLPSSADVLRSSAQLGGRLACLLDAERVDGVTHAPFLGGMHLIGRLARVDGSAIDASLHLEVNQSWGRRQQGGVFPGLGHVVVRDYSSDEMKGMEQLASELKVGLQDLIAILGSQTCDVYLNEGTFWSNIPENVWSYTIGGYQVVKKWLSYREAGILNRSLTADEAKEVRETARRITAILLLQPELNTNYRLVQKDPAAWPPPHGT